MEELQFYKALLFFFFLFHIHILQTWPSTAKQHIGILKERRWLRTIRNKEKTFLHKPPARLFSGSTFDQWRLDGLGTGPITSKWNIEFPFFKDQSPFTGGGIFKCRPACQVVYILLLEKSQSPKAMHNGYSMTSKQRQFKEKLCGFEHKFWWNNQNCLFGLETSNHTLSN